MTLLRHGKRQAKKLICGGLYHSGFLDRRRARIMRRAAVVLLYHRIVDRVPEFLDYSPSGMTVTQADFEAQMHYIQRHYRVVPLAEIVSRLSGGHELDDAMCAVTFDDGWRDNYTHALPVLKRLRIPATIFLATHFIDGLPWFWEERLKYTLGHLHQRYQELATASKKRAEVLRLLRDEGLDDALLIERAALPRRLTAFVNTLRDRGADQRMQTMDAIEDALRIEGFAEPRRFLTWDEVREMAEAGIAFGAHTTSHMNLTRCDASTADYEMRRSREIVSEQLGRDQRVLAYPYGKNTPAIRQLAQQAGFSAALTTGPGFIRQGDDCMGLSRIDIRERVAGTLPDFASRLLGLVHVH
jgi:peptidoglycan/xylan/chitin deacetylase (PgdA/CDA1 family)